MAIENNFIDSQKDQRRIDLLNDANYGIVLCFLDQFRSILDLPHYPLQLFEDHLINYQEQNPSRLIDFHFILLKRLSLAKNAQRDKFDSIITKFVSRFDSNDSEQLATIDYLHIDINLKVRIIKYLLESQFDLNQTFKNTISEKSSCDIKSLPLGRDRFGASYWFFMDSNCFVRLFREDVNNDRTWTNIAKNREELEKFIQLLITDSTVRKRFPDWIIDYEPYSSLLRTSEFEQCYLPIRGEELETTPDNIENSDLSKDKDESSSPEISTKRKRGRPKRSTESTIEVDSSEVQKETETTIDDDDEESDVLKKRNSRSRKRKVTTEEQEVSLDDMSLATRRSSRLRPTSVVTPDSTSQLSDTIQKHSIKTKTKISPTLRSRRRRKKPSRRNMDDYFCLSTSSSDEHIDDLTDDEYNSDDHQYLVDVEDHFFELDEDNNSMNDQELRTAKTAHTSTIITTCYICSKSDRPEVLLLCDDCNDAYHLECLYPALLSVPEGDWYCPLCEQKQLSICLINRLKELLIHFNTADTKKQIRSTKKLFQRKIKVKEYSSDESITASESDNNDDSMLSTSQINENSNLSSSYFDDEKQSISQRGRHRRTRFDIKKMLDDEYIDDDADDNSTDKTNFHLQLPKKITRLLHRHDRSLIKNDSQTRTLPTRLCDTSFDLNEKLGSPLVYVNADENSHQTKSVITNSKQTLKIVRRWNDVQRRSRLKATNMKLVNETITSDYIDENSGFATDDISLPYSNDSNSNSATKDDDGTINHSRITSIQPASLVPIDKCSPRNITKKSDANFDRLTRDIQNAVDEAHVLPTTTKVINHKQVKRIQKTIFSPYMSKTPFPSCLSQLPNDACNIFKSQDSSIATSDSSISLIPSSTSSSVLDISDELTTSFKDT